MSNSTTYSGYSSTSNSASESLSGGTEVRDEVVTAAEAVRFIRDGDSVVVKGFVGQCFAE